MFVSSYSCLCYLHLLWRWILWASISSDGCVPETICACLPGFVPPQILWGYLGYWWPGGLCWWWHQNVKQFSLYGWLVWSTSTCLPLGSLTLCSMLISRPRVTDSFYDYSWGPCVSIQVPYNRRDASNFLLLQSNSSIHPVIFQCILRDQCIMDYVKIHYGSQH